MPIDPNLYTGALLFLLGMICKTLFDLLTPYLKGWLARVSAHAQLRLNDRKHQQQVLHGKAQPKQTQAALNQQPTAIT